MFSDWIYFNSQDENYKTPFGAMTCLSKVILNLRIALNVHVDAVELLSGKNEQDFDTKKLYWRKNENGFAWYGCELQMPGTEGILWYCFRINVAGEIYYCGNNDNCLGGKAIITKEYYKPYQITVYKKGFSAPEWARNAIMYQIFPDRYYNGNEDGVIDNPKEGSLLHAKWQDNPVYTCDQETGKILAYDFFGGNILGIIKKLPHLKGLGINTIYLNPIFEAESNHRYDTGDYNKIDPMLGNEKIFQELCTKAGNLGIKIILDGVFSHTGSNSIYFNKDGKYDSLGAYQSSKSPYRSWYRFGEYKNGYDSWWGIETMPNVNETEQSYLRYIVQDENSVVKKWSRLGASGWRLDVADELPDEFIAALRKELKSVNQDALLIGEVWEDASKKCAYNELRKYFLGDELDSVMNYPFRNAVLGFVLGYHDSFKVHELLMSLYENYPKEVFYSCMNLLGTHDIPRILTILGEGQEESQKSRYEQFHTRLSDEQRKLAVARLKMLSLWQLTFPGAPCIYYGDEAGLEGHKDPLNRRTYPWGNEDKELLEWYENIIALRNKFHVLRTGSWHSMPVNKNVYAFIRVIKGGKDEFGCTADNNKAIIVLNASGKEQEIEVDVSNFISKKAQLYDIIRGYQKTDIIEGKIFIRLKPYEGRVFLQELRERKSGVLLHPTSLPGRYGIGDLGREAYEFIDFLEQSNQSIWQVLPLNPVGYGESPYQGLSAFAGNHMLISIDKLVEMGLLQKNDCEIELEGKEFPTGKVDFVAAKSIKDSLLKKAYKKFSRTKTKCSGYETFIADNDFWLKDYALFMALKEHYGGISWVGWDKKLVERDEAALAQYEKKLKNEIAYQVFLQYIFAKQWSELKAYANEKKINIVGDLPIFVAHDSSDVWVNRHLFELYEDGNPALIAGVPPDYFSPTGQRWGNPQYRWDEMKKDDYLWWRQRIAVLLKSVDVVRIDHFRGFEAYWEIPASEATAVNGRWVKGPGADFFAALEKHLGDIPIIAENLGFLTQGVHDLKNQFSLPGMIILQFAFNGEKDRPFAPFSYNMNDVLYTGTHDNETLLSWCERMQEEQPQLVREIKKIFALKEKASAADICWQLNEYAFTTACNSVIIPLQDLLAVGKEGRMNTPSILGGNWEWRFEKKDTNAKIAARLLSLTKTYGRNLK